VPQLKLVLHPCVTVGSAVGLASSLMPLVDPVCVSMSNEIGCEEGPCHCVAEPGRISGNSLQVLLRGLLDNGSKLKEVLEAAWSWCDCE
jgi:hypothetical protein